MTDTLVSFLLGSAVTACLIVSAFFGRFWRRAGDRLFLAFALAFLLFAVNWAMVAVVEEETYAEVYLFRLLGFAIIIAGVIGKNRSSGAATPP